MVSFTPDVPGRGAWTLAGGLLRLRPGHANPAGYYRLARDGEQQVGRAGLDTATRTHSQRVVHAAVRELQLLVGAVPDGVLGPKTAGKICEAQAAAGLTVDGVVGPVTMRALLAGLIGRRALHWDVPVSALGGIAAHESRLDLAAVGVANGVDTGLCQINLGAAGAASLTPENAVSPLIALNWTGTELAKARTRWEGHTHGVPIIKIMVANHNSPRSAQRWADTGEPPFSQNRADHGWPQIDEYVTAVLAAWTETP
jgi:hypothetical protein